MSRFTCSTQLIDKGSLSLKLLLCLRGYKRFAGLYDLYMSAYTVHDPQQSLHTSLSLTGVSNDNARAFLATYLESLTWQPTP